MQHKIKIQMFQILKAKPVSLPYTVLWGWLPRKLGREEREVLW